MGGREGSHRENKNRRKASGTDVFYSSRHRYYLEITNRSIKRLAHWFTLEQRDKVILMSSLINGAAVVC